MSQREILFRGKDNHGNWHEGGFAHWDSTGAYGHNMHHSIIKGSYNGVYDVSILPETLGQYTGLKDKNGVKIFEGDVISHIGERIGVVKYYPEIGVFGFTDKPESESESDAWHFYDCQPMIFEVVVNIHDNPELLTQNPQQK